MFQTIFLKKWTDNFTSTEIIAIAIEQWKKGLTGISDEAIAKAIDHCRMNLEWPPSIAEFIGICEKFCGVPSVDEAFQAAIRRDFDHPVIKLAFDKVGSWAMRNDNEDVLRKKFKDAYREALGFYREANAMKHKQLESANDR